MIRNKILQGRAGLCGSSWGLKGQGWDKKFSPSCGTGRGWGKKNSCGAGEKIPSFGPVPPHCHPYSYLPIVSQKKKKRFLLRLKNCTFDFVNILLCFFIQLPNKLPLYQPLLPAPPPKSFGMSI